MQTEKWETIKSFPNYQVSSYGNIRTKQFRTYLKQYKKGRYSVVKLYESGVGKTVSVHKLVANAFLENQLNKQCVNHIDGNKKNNYIDNLEWCTTKENVNHAYDNDLNTCNKKIILVHKMTDEILFFRSRTKANEFLGVNKNTIFRLFKRGENEIGNYFVFERK